MADHQAILEEEFEVLESIFPDELEKLSDTSVRIRVEPEEQSSSHPLTLWLVVVYPPTYPDVIPELSFEPTDDEEGELQDGEEETVLEQLRTTAEESLGMAMTFTIASAAREALAEVVQTRIRREKEEDDRKTREYEEAEAARTRGTPLTPENFNAWRKKFSKELQEKREREEEERVKAMTPKEREDWKKRKERPTGKQLFETSKALADDSQYYEEGAAEVDLSIYTREEREKERRKEEDEEERRRQGLLADDND